MLRVTNGPAVCRGLLIDGATDSNLLRVARVVDIFERRVFRDGAVVVQGCFAVPISPISAGGLFSIAQKLSRFELIIRTFGVRPVTLVGLPDMRFDFENMSTNIHTRPVHHAQLQRHRCAVPWTWRSTHRLG